MRQTSAVLAATPDTFEVITFEADGTRYAVPIEQVRYIQKDSSSTTRIGTTDSSSFHVVRFEGQPVPVLDFADWTSGKAIYRTNEALITVLEDRERDHLDWMDALERTLTTGAPFTKAKDPHQCAFGKWYDEFKTDDEMLADLLKDFDKPHKRIHSLADQLLSLQQEQGTDAAMSIFEQEKLFTLARLRELFADARDRLRSITRPVLVYLVKKDGQLVAVRLNALSDIETHSWGEYSPYEAPSSKVRALPIIKGYLQSKQNPMSPLVLLDFGQYE